MTVFDLKLWKDEVNRLECEWKAYFYKDKRNEIESVLLEHFGEKCKDFEPNCHCCKKYKALEVLFENPYED